MLVEWLETNQDDARIHSAAARPERDSQVPRLRPG